MKVRISRGQPVAVVDAYDFYASSLAIPRTWSGLYSDFYPTETAIVQSAETGLSQASSRLVSAVSSGAESICLGQYPDSTR